MIHFKEKDSGLTIADNLMRFTDATRLARAEKIEDEIRFINQTTTTIEVNMKQYYIKIDLKSHRIIHDCDDWKKMLVPSGFVSTSINFF